jgi:hypothetical protein
MSTAIFCTMAARNLAETVLWQGESIALQCFANLRIVTRKALQF